LPHERFFIVGDKTRVAETGEKQGEIGFNLLGDPTIMDPELDNSVVADDGG
jgi:hypothetical protein